MTDENRELLIRVQGILEGVSITAESEKVSEALTVAIEILDTVLEQEHENAS
ncbi:MAG: hypothetical protein IJ344_04120 [Clostridia bacterium]|nr:hypothetical protein [Clostridia bacterium]